ncbi:MAG TPA: hypothetical protein VGS57_02025 [Thermoanaerobaculia bacterium]|nr:hypothetical protein [Thermoanaerobaculia bacterium]
MDAAWSPAALLPAALVLACGAALLAALRRWYDAVPWRVAAAFALLLVLLLWPVLVGGKVLLPLGNLVGFPPWRGLPPPQPPTHAIQGDLVHQIVPWQAEVRRSLADGRWPLWNEHAGAGMPLMADPQSQVFQPLVAVALPLPLSAAMGVTGALRILLALVGMFVLLRRQGIGEAAALVGSVGYGLCGAMLLWLGWPLANAVAWTPLGLYAVVRCHRDGGRRDVALLAAVTAALLLGGHPETIVQSGVLIGLFVLACAWERRRNGSPVAPFVLRCAGAAAVAGLLLAPLLLLQQGYLPATDRATALRWFLAMPSLTQLWSFWQRAEAWRAWAARVEPQLLSLFALRAWGGHELFWGEANFVEQGSASVGAAVGVLAVAAVMRRRARMPQESLLIGFSTVALLLIAKPPLIYRFVGQLPLLGPSSVHENHRLMLLVALAACYLAACEVERWTRGERAPRALAIGAAIVVGVLAWAYLGHLPPGSAERTVQAWWLALQVAAGLFVVGLTFLLGSAIRLRRSAPWLLAVVVAAELVTLHRSALVPAPSRLFYPRAPSLDYLAQHLGGDRLVALADTLPANFAQVLGFNDVRIDGPARPNAYVQLIDPLRDPGPVTLANAAQLGQPGARLYDLLGVRYVLGPPGWELPLPVAYRDGSLWIYEHPRPLPRFFLPPAATIYRGADWTAWFRRQRDFAARALVAAGPPGADAPRWRARRGRAAFTFARRETTRWTADVRAPEPRLLTGAVYQDGGWRLLVDGRPHETVPANGPLFGAWLPAGEHHLDLLYRPRRFVAGCLLAALALAAGLAWLTPPPRSPTRSGRRPCRRGAARVAA